MLLEILYIEFLGKLRLIKNPACLINRDYFMIHTFSCYSTALLEIKVQLVERRNFMSSETVELQLIATRTFMRINLH